MLPVTPYPPMRVGAWGSPFSNPREIRLSQHRGRYVLPKGGWIVRCGNNRVEMELRAHDPMEDWIRMPGTGLRPGSPGAGKPPSPRPPRPPRPPTGRYYHHHPASTSVGEVDPEDEVQESSVDTALDQDGGDPFEPMHAGSGHNSGVRRLEIVQRGRTGSVFADGQNVIIVGSGEATIIQVYSV